MFDIRVGDMRVELDAIDENSVDASVTDPPYHLTSIVKRFGADGAAPAKAKQSGVYERSSRGFMGQTWDGGDIAFQPETWARVLRVLKPGAHLLAFAASKNAHRLFCAIEDAGFEIRDTIMWLYGSGFPKSHNLDGEWEGWGSALKPAYEPIVLARKPLVGTIEKNVRQFGTGALNIDACRVATNENLNGGAYAKDATARDQMWGEDAGNSWVRGGAGNYEQPLGRWPANIIHDGSDEVLVGFPESKGQQGRSTDANRSKANTYGEPSDNGKVYDPRGDEGSAARFFYCAKASKADRDEGLDGLPDRVLAMSNQAKVRKNNHPTVKPTDLMRYLCRLVTPPGGLILDPFMGSGSTGKAAMLEGFRFIGCEMKEDYAEIARARISAALPGWLQ